MDLKQIYDIARENNSYELFLKEMRRQMNHSNEIPINVFEWHINKALGNKAPKPEDKKPDN